MAPPADAEPDTYGPGQLAEFVAAVDLGDPDKVVDGELDEDEHRTFREHQRRLLAHNPQLRQRVASRVPAPIVPLRDVGHDARPGDNARRRGSRRSSGSSPPSDDPDPEPELAAFSRPTERRAAI
jgi:hypothetical protein